MSCCRCLCLYLFQSFCLFVFLRLCLCLCLHYCLCLRPFISLCPFRSSCLSLPLSRSSCRSASFLLPMKNVRIGKMNDTLSSSSSFSLSLLSSCLSCLSILRTLRASFNPVPRRVTPSESRNPFLVDPLLPDPANLDKNGPKPFISRLTAELDVCISVPDLGRGTSFSEPVSFRAVSSRLRKFLSRGTPPTVHRSRLAPLLGRVLPASCFLSVPGVHETSRSGGSVDRTHRN